MISMTWVAPPVGRGSAGTPSSKTKRIAKLLSPKAAISPPSVLSRSLCSHASSSSLRRAALLGVYHRRGLTGRKLDPVGRLRPPLWRPGRGSGQHRLHPDLLQRPPAASQAAAARGRALVTITTADPTRT
jgi:hypothetical protein